MNFIEIAADKNVCKDHNLKIKILIFTEGTIIGPKNLFQHFNYAAYVPIGTSSKEHNLF